MNITVIGLGLIGGSLAIDLRAAGFGTRFIGVDANEAHAQEALSLGLVDETMSLQNAVEASDLIILAIPVNHAKGVLLDLLDLVNETQIVMDMGSTKAGICLAAANHQRRRRFVASHPIAGTENTGPSAAIPNLYRGKMTIICEDAKSDADAVELAKKLYDTIGMDIVHMSAEEHDKHIAYVSHLSHISSFTLGLTVLEMEKSEKNIFNLAGSGFASTVRLAKSSPAMWAPIFEQNSDNLLGALDTYIEQLSNFRTLIAEKETDELHKLMGEANNIRRILDGIALKG